MHRFCPAIGRACIGERCVSFVSMRTPLQAKINVVECMVEYPTEEVIVCSHYRMKLDRVEAKDDNKKWSKDEDVYKSTE